MSNLFMVFDVESIGLHGESFAVGYVVINRKQEILDENLFSCDPKLTRGSFENHNWVLEYVPTMNYHFSTSRDVRNAFWEKWIYWKQQDALLVADCGWPVESNFLTACINDCIVKREWNGPYPFLDLASLLFAHKKAPLETYSRLENELPEHNPLNDARQSARIFTDILKEMNFLYQ